MQAKLGQLSDLKFNLETWKRELRFHFDEMDTFQEKLEEISIREFGQDARHGIEKFENRIMLEKSAIAKLKHRCKAKMRELDSTHFDELNLNRVHIEQSPLREDMRMYIKMHYDLKEEMMNFFTEYLQN
jgi:hypothetical protein